MKTPVCKIYTNIIRKIYVKNSIYTLVNMVQKTVFSLNNNFFLSFDN